MIIIETCPRCGHDLANFNVATYPPIPAKYCFACGWKWEGEPEELVRVPFGGNTYLTKTNKDYRALDESNYIEKRFVPMQLSDAAYDGSPCEHCSNNPKNGGSGICHCILGQQAVVY